ncbi:MAG TPA: phosphotransferase [Acidimicrobiia bacterium]|jgi:trehalose synthase-fused probable maltokinase|nr:phosphotransferase [Acidimicrobiia bacterium]
MTDSHPGVGTLPALDDSHLVDYLCAQRWFAGTTRELVGAAPIDVVPIGDGMAIALVEVHFRTGTRDLYQLLVDEHSGEALDLAQTAELARRLTRLSAFNETLDTADGHLLGRSIRPLVDTETAEAHALDADQSNSSMVVGDVMLKTYRRIEAGVNPELEMLLFFAEHGFDRVPGLVGWYAYEGAHIDATLGVMQCFVSDVTDGWQLALDEVPHAPNEYLDRLDRLGAIVGTMHQVLASDLDDAAFAPEDSAPDGTALLVARVDEEIDRLFDEFSDREELAPLVGRRDDAHAQVGALASALAPARTIRTHGDLHLGQVLWTGDDWLVIDFEGEPTRPASSRRQKALPLRDVAGLLRSIGYLVSTLTRQDRPAPDGWERDARERLLAGYRSAAPASLLPATDEARARQLALFELEKAFYEVRYELDHRPDWVGIPVQSILDVLERGVS